MFSVTKIAYIANFNFAKQKGSVKENLAKKVRAKLMMMLDSDDDVTCG